MKLKYYLRGLGIGIVVTALVIGVSLSKTEKIEEIPLKDTVLTELEQTTEEMSQEESETESKNQESAIAESSEIESTQQESSQPESSEPESSQPESTTNADEKLSETPSSADVTEEGKLIQIVINNGEGSNHVSKKLADAKLVESASSYDQFLCKNGYDKKLVAGIHMIPEDATDEEIAKILCTRN